MATQALLTLEQYHALPEKQRVDRELLRGRLIEMSVPQFEHGFIQVKFAAFLASYVKETGADFEVATHTGFLLSDETELAPDACVIGKQKRRSLAVVKGALRGSPDLAGEIVSPSEAAEDLHVKVMEYLAAGTQIVWVAYATTRHVLAYYPNGVVRNVSVGQHLDAPNLLPGLRIPVADLFPQ